ncbi:MAG: heat shock protein Hsp20, family protein [Candidatus Taylorbacteria bacterium]|nr:heat shock protein Hsp20, family protein [Candidatus Taylorbacteria bacterium]
MPKEKKSFFERLTGTVRVSDDRDDQSEHSKHHARSDKKHFSISSLEEEVSADRGNGERGTLSAAEELESEDAELTIDVYQTSEAIIIKSMIAGVRPEDLDVNITRDMVTIKGTRAEEHVISEDDYFAKELYWGSFSRTVSLPEEIDVDEAEAVEKHGLLILTLPKLDKKRQSKLKVKTA